MENKIVELAKRLISVPSTKGETANLKTVLEIAKSELAGFSYKEFASNGIPSLLFVNLKEFPEKFTVILDAHLDVVPGNPEQFKPTVTGNKLFGRGAYDMKSAAAAEILVFKEMARKAPYPLGLQLVTDEETGGFDGAKYQASRGVRTECMIAGESSSDLAVKIQGKGVIWMKIGFVGTAAHSAYLWDGRNAIRELNMFLSKLWKQFPIPAEKVWKTTVNAAIVGTTNITGNKVPGDAMCQLDIRYLPGEGESTINNIKSLLPENATVEILENEPAMNTPENDKYVQRFVQIAEKSLNRTISIVGMHGASDLRHFPDAAGIEFGPVGAGPHADNEWVDINSLGTFSKILKDFLLSFPAI